jgi:hypothetical protein
MKTNKEAYHLLKECSKNKDLTKWNEFRNKTNDKAISLRFKNLRGFYLIGANLDNINCSGADLENADLYNASVTNTNISSSIYLTIAIITFIFTIIAIFTLASFSNVGLEVIAVAAVTIGTGIAAVATTVAVASAGAVVIVAGASAITIAFTGDIGAIVAIGAALAVATGVVSMLNGANQEAISLALNPADAIGFENEFLTNKKTNLSKLIQQQINLTIDEKKKATLEEEKEEYLQKEKLEKTLDTKLSNINTILLSPYNYIDKQIKILNRHTWFFYLLIISIMCLIIYIGYNGFYTQTEDSFKLLFKTKSPDFSTILFYSTPLLFAMAILVYLIASINNNLKKITDFQQHKQFIKILLSTLKVKIAVNISDEEFQYEVKKIADLLQQRNLNTLDIEQQKPIVKQNNVIKNNKKPTSKKRFKLLLQ